VLKDIAKDFFDGNALIDAKRIRQLKDNLCGYLKSLNIGTANCENDARPELGSKRPILTIQRSCIRRDTTLLQTLALNDLNGIPTTITVTISGTTRLNWSLMFI
jgi:hypothetical protein